VSEVPDLVLHDLGRDKDIHVRILYPNRPAKYPVIIFSADAAQNCCDALTRYWASHGYVIVQSARDYSVSDRPNASVEQVRFKRNPRGKVKDSRPWESRPVDISFLIDSLPDLQKRVPGLVGKLDVDHVGVAGHGGGSYAAEAVAGASINVPGHPEKSFADPRVRAVLCLSPQGPGQFGMTDRSFEQLVLPYIGITGSFDTSGPMANSAWHRVPFERSQSGDKYHVFIRGANQISFIGTESASTSNLVSQAHDSPPGSILGYTNSAAIAFWTAYLKHDSAAKRYLQSDALQNSSKGAVKIERR
jgi:predicted dienelactone hydrolase